MTINYYDREGDLITLPEFVALLEDRNYRRIASEEVGPYWVSTVWLGLDHGFLSDGPPLIFETMIFGAEDYMDRYPTEAAALAGHDQAVAWARERWQGS